MSKNTIISYASLNLDENKINLMCNFDLFKYVLKNSHNQKVDKMTARKSLMICLNNKYLVIMQTESGKNITRLSCLNFLNDFLSTIITEIFELLLCFLGPLNLLLAK